MFRNVLRFFAATFFLIERLFAFAFSVLSVRWFTDHARSVTVADIDYTVASTPERVSHRMGFTGLAGYA